MAFQGVLQLFHLELVSLNAPLGLYAVVTFWLALIAHMGPEPLRMECCSSKVTVWAKFGVFSLWLYKSLLRFGT